MRTACKKDHFKPSFSRQKRPPGVAQRSGAKSGAQRLDFSSNQHASASNQARPNVFTLKALSVSASTQPLNPRNIHKLDYGIPCGPPPELLQQQAAIAKASNQRVKRQADEARTNAFRWFHSQSTNGDVSAQYRLGVYYLTGNGCATNRVEALKWLRLSASGGNLEASNKLATLAP